jgi:hypothetical protein
MKKKIIRSEVKNKTTRLAELFIKKLSQPNAGWNWNIRNRKESIVKYSVNLKIEILN